MHLYFIVICTFTLFLFKTNFQPNYPFLPPVHQHSDGIPQRGFFLLKLGSFYSSLGGYLVASVIQGVDEGSFLLHTYLAPPVNFTGSSDNLTAGDCLLRLTGGFLICPYFAESKLLIY